MKKIVGNASDKLIKGTTIYMIGNITSKLMQVMLLPIITGILFTEEYGYYDIIISTGSLLLPFITLQLTEALFKFLLKSNKKEKASIVSTVASYLLVGIGLLAIVLFILNEITDIIQYPILIFLHYATLTIYTFYQKITRSLQKNKAFAISGVLHTFVLILTEIILLIGFKMRLEALLLAHIVSSIVCILYLEYVIAARKMIAINAVSGRKLKTLLKFSIPLVPNSISWWFINSVNTYFVAFYLGVGSNGIYSVANKFPQLLTFMTSVFHMAWQESAIIESDSNERNRFYSDVFNTYVRLLLTALIVVLPFVKIFVPYLIDEKYLGGIPVIPILLLGVVFTSFSQFYGVGYFAFNKTTGALSTTLLAAAINVVICISLLPYIGLFAPALGTLFAYLVQWIYRMYQMRSYFKIKMDWKPFFFYGSIVAIYMLMFYIIESNYIQVTLFLLACLIFLLANKSLIKDFFKKTFGQEKNKR